MQLADIITFIEPKETVLGSPECQITELAIDSRKVTVPEHTLFFAIETENGTRCFHCTVPVQPTRLHYKLYMADVIADSVNRLLFNPAD